MLPKPPGCNGCPYAAYPGGFVPDEYVPGAMVCLVLRNPGSSEVEGKHFEGYEGGLEKWGSGPIAPAIGKAGFELRKYLPLAGLERGHNVSLANTIRCRLGDTDDMGEVTDPTFQEAAAHCQHAYFRPSESTRVFLAMGEHALYALTGEDGAEKGEDRGLSSWRGWLLPYNPPPLPKLTFSRVWTPREDEKKILATYHPAFLFRAPGERTAARADWGRLSKILKGTWPIPLPTIQRTPPTLWPMLSAFDTEFNEFTKVLTRYSMATRAQDTTRLWVVEAEGAHIRVPHLPVVGTKRMGPRVIFHNAPADWWHLVSILPPETHIEIEDTMAMHALLWSDLAHDLNYLGSLYAKINRWKHLYNSNPIEYSGGDAAGTLDCWELLSEELGRDPMLEQLYRTLSIPSIQIIAKAEQRGSRVNQARVQEVLKELEGKKVLATRRAQAYTGYPIKLGSSQQVATWIYDVEKIGGKKRGDVRAM